MPTTRCRDQRIRTQSQIRLANTRGEAMKVTEIFAVRAADLERQYKNALHAFAKAHPVGLWSLSIPGIGPVISAGLLAHIDIDRAPNVGKLWRYAGLDPSLPAAAKGEKRKYNAALKRLCWLIGESFVKVSTRDNDIYGEVYAARKDLENDRNDPARVRRPS